MPPAEPISPRTASARLAYRHTHSTSPSATYAARDRREQSWGEHLAGVLAGRPATDRAQLSTALPALRRLAARLAGDPDI